MTVVAGDTVGHDAVGAGFVRLVDDVRRPGPAAHPATPTRRGRGARPEVTDPPEARKRPLSVLRVDM